MNYGLLVLLSLGTVAMQSCSEAIAEDKRFSDLIQNGDLGADVVVQVDSGDVLVFDGGTYYLGGKNLIVLSESSKVVSNTTINSWNPSDIPETVEGTPGDPGKAEAKKEGKPGLPGAAGNTGKPSGVFVFDIEDINFENNSILNIEAVGQEGGHGQKGGQGGKGASGVAGRDAKSDFPSCSRPCPGRGGRGYPGGTRGPGGQGGQGGKGGMVHLSEALFNLFTQKDVSLKVSVMGGQGGKGGEPGERGIGGNGGPRGQGGNCECKDVPPPADNGDLGPNDPPDSSPSLPGDSGSVSNLAQP